MALGHPATVEQALADFEPLVRAEARRFGDVPGMDTDDLRQIARLAVAEAFEARTPGQPFAPLARRIIRRRLVDALPVKGRSGRQMIDETDRFERVLPGGEDGHELTLGDVIPDPSSAPETAAERAETLRRIVAHALSLPRLQRLAFAGRLAGMTYRETAALIGGSPESVRNAGGVASARIRDRLRAEGALA